MINGGEKVLQDFLSEQENLIFCVLEQFNPEVGANDKLKRIFINFKYDLLSNTLKDLLSALLDNCITYFIKMYFPQVIQYEIESRKLTGDVDTVFKRYCR